MDLKNFTRRLSRLLLLILPGFINAQVSNGYCDDPKFESKVSSLLNYTVPVLSVDDLTQFNKDDVILLDARELEEYQTSHIPGAIYIGYDNPDWSVLDNLNKDARIVTYCSIGYRSEKLGEKIAEQGFNKVYNLYGSIFEWANKGLPLVDGNEDKTNKVHTYNKKWSQWVINPKITKTW